MNRTSVSTRSAIRPVTALVAAILAFPGVAAAQSTAQGTPPIIYNRSTASTTLSYWTADRLATAVPADMGLSGASALPGEAPASSGKPGAGGGIRPLRSASQNSEPPADSALAESAEEIAIPADGAYPGPNTTYEYTPDYRTYPISTIGKLFFTQPGVGDFQCSASVTTGGTAKNIVWTAGHCVADGGKAKFYTNWLFCPSYKDGKNAQLGCWSWLYATTSGEWFSNGSLSRDYAIIGLQHTGDVVKSDVADSTGGLGFAWNWSRDQNWVHIGYPAASPYNGLRIIYTGTEHRYDDTAQGTPATNSWGSPQTPGSSGSPVILFFSYGGGFINSDVSYFYTSQAGKELQGPYFDTQVCNFWKSNTLYTGTC